MDSILSVVKSGWELFQHYFTLFLRLFLDHSTDFIFGLLNRNGRKSLPLINDVILLESAETLADKIRTKKLKSRQVVESFINRIKEVNPILNAVVHDNFEQAIQEANKVDALIAFGLKSKRQLEKETPFLGVPFTSKDSIGVKGLRQTCCSIGRKDVICDQDAEVITLMRKAGAISLGNTNTSELCFWWESNNNVYGTTNNPYDTTRTVGGSSGGEGAIVGAAGSVIGIGSDIGGSIQIPAVFNGIFGHKATSGVVNNDGELPAAAGETDKFVSKGPLCRYATDMLPVFKILAHNYVGKLRLDEKVHIPSLRIFYMTDKNGCPSVSRVNSDIKKALLKVIDYFEATHGIKAKKVNVTKLKHSADMWFAKMAGSGAPKMSEELAFGKGKVNCKWELAKWFIRLSNFTLPVILSGVTENSGGPGSSEYDTAVKICTDLEKEFDELLGSNGVFIYPTHPRPPPYHNQPLFMPLNFSYTGVFNVLGLPSSNCPLGLNGDGLPIGVQVVANKYNDRLCLAMACELERAFGGWVSPSHVT